MRRNYRPNLFGFGGKKPTEPKPAKPRTVVRDGQWHYVFGMERERGLDRGMKMAEAKAYAEQKADEDWHRREGKMEWNPGLPGARRRTYGLPPRPAPRQRSTRERIARMAREYEEEERPFDPERPVERHVRPHHFAVNQDELADEVYEAAYKEARAAGASHREADEYASEAAVADWHERVESSGGPWEEEFYENQRMSPALQEAQTAPARTKRILAAAAEKTRHPKVRAMILEDRGGQWSKAVHDAERLSERVGGAVDKVPMTREQLDEYLAAIVRLEALDYVMSHRSRYSQNAPRGGPVDEAAAEALELWIDNTANLSPGGPSGKGRAIVINLMRKVRKGKYDPALAPKIWMYLVDDGAKDYVKHDDERRPWHVKFNMATRKALAERYARRFEEEVEAGEWDDLDTSMQRNPAGQLSPLEVERLPVGSVVYAWEARMAMALMPDGGLAPITILPERAGGHEPEGEPIASFGQSFTLVKEGRGRLFTHATAQRAVIAWMQAQQR